jgi:hypothetical protein
VSLSRLATCSEIKEDLADWLAETGWEGEQKAEDLADALTTWTQRSETAKLAALLDSMAARWPHVPELASKLVLPAAQCGHVAVIMLLHECAQAAQQLRLTAFVKLGMSCSLANMPSSASCKRVLNPHCAKTWLGHP